jgi:hypothetical protein
MREKDRDRVKAPVDLAGHDISFCFVNADREVRRQRVLRRNIEKGETYSFDVTPAMFDATEMYFEPPTERERICALKIIGEMSHG